MASDALTHGAFLSWGNGSCRSWGVGAAAKRAGGAAPARFCSLVAAAAKRVAKVRTTETEGGDGTHRETTVDRLEFAADGTILPVVPTLGSIRPVRTDRS
ncbi:hypothetical protein GCM10011579_041220 [Streptomyces albiflavescens]|uniref:Uncharacterized protein n=1 Tax=Streptomyces albiflavescens TaxID=1623582 RepID=A0A918D510_9ACTN|nr:hypothetical protein GCM10011579_041220 [Streptomyces albiflavescens]